MALHGIYTRYEPSSEDLSTREAIIENLTRHATCDVLVVGGGITGAVMAHAAALNGFNTVLLEKADYASGASGATGNLLLDPFRPLTVRRALGEARTIADLAAAGTHLVQPLLMPAANGPPPARWSAWKNRLMMRRVRPAPAEEEFLGAAGGAHASCRRTFFRNASIQDTRLVVEHVLAARQEGARCLNYASVNSYAMRPSGGLTVGWSDVLSQKQFEIFAGIVVNCAGAWAAYTGRITPAGRSRLRWRKVGHYLFNCDWPYPPLLVGGKGGRASCYVLPRPEGVLVGRTVRALESLPSAAAPDAAEIDECLEMFSGDPFEGRFSRDAMHWCYAAIESDGDGGMETAPAWHYSNGVLTLAGGDMSNARLAAGKGLGRVLAAAGVSRKLMPLRARKLPGAGLLDSAASEFRHKARREGVPDNFIEAAIARLGSRVRLLNAEDGGFEIVGDLALRGEIELALQDEQAETLADVLERRLAFVRYPHHGLELCSPVLQLLRRKRAGIDVEEEERCYRERVAAIRRRIAGRE